MAATGKIKKKRSNKVKEEKVKFPTGNYLQKET
jgi:hypothetical protein